MTLQQEISRKKSEYLIGKHMKVIVDGYLPEEDVYVCRSFRDAPGVDGQVFVHPGADTSREIMSGTFLYTVITGATEYDLIGDIAEE